MKTIKTKRPIFFAWLFIPVLILSGQISLKDHPLKGEWHFTPEKIWEIDKAGDEDFGRIAELLITDKHIIAFRDFERKISYLFDADGRFLKKFAPQGKEDGRLSFYLNRFQAGDKIVLAAPDKLHYFSQDGAFDHAAENNLFLRFPLFFIDEHEFIYAPTLPQSPVHDKKLVVFDLLSGKEKMLADFSEPELRGQKTAPSPMVMIFSLTPQVRLDYDGETMVFGRSDQYTIFLADPSGKILSSFGLDRKKMLASPEDKRKHVSDSDLPKEVVEKILAQLPDEMTHFSHLVFRRGLIYVFAVTDMEQKTASQAIDIFSEKGEYLYRGTMGFGGHLKFGSPSNMILKDDFVYVILENDQGKQTLAKYRIRWPLSPKPPRLS